VVVSGLVLNFVPDRLKALAEMKRGGPARAAPLVFFRVGLPDGGMGFMRAFWDAATALDPNALDLQEGRRIPFCTPEGLTEMAVEADVNAVAHTAIEVPTVFSDFEDFWRPFTLGAGPAPGYCMSLTPEARERLRRSCKTRCRVAPMDRSRWWPERGRSGVGSLELQLDCHCCNDRCGGVFPTVWAKGRIVVASEQDHKT
jgi:hypothetical protein